MSTPLSDPVVRTFRIPRDLYERLGSVRGLESLNGEVVRRLEASFRVQVFEKSCADPRCLMRLYWSQESGSARDASLRSDFCPSHS